MGAVPCTHTTWLQRPERLGRRRMNVKTTLCAYWVVFARNNYYIRKQTKTILTLRKRFGTRGNPTSQYIMMF